MHVTDIADAWSPARLIEDDRVSVVIAARNHQNDLASVPARHRAQTILTDNDSHDGTVRMARRVILASVAGRARW